MFFFHNSYRDLPILYPQGVDYLIISNVIALEHTRSMTFDCIWAACERDDKKVLD